MVKSALRKISDLTGETESEVQDYIDLSRLTDDFLDLIDEGKLSLKAGLDKFGESSELGRSKSSDG